MLLIWYLCLYFFACIGFVAFLGFIIWMIDDVLRPRWAHTTKTEREQAFRDAQARKYGLVAFYPVRDRIIRRDAIDASRITGQFATDQRKGFEDKGVVR